MVDRSPPQISFHSGMSEAAPRATGMKGLLFLFVHRKDTFLAIDAFVLLCFLYFLDHGAQQTTGLHMLSKKGGA